MFMAPEAGALALDLLSVDFNVCPHVKEQKQLYIATLGILWVFPLVCRCTVSLGPTRVLHKGVSA